MVQMFFLVHLSSLAAFSALPSRAKFMNYSSDWVAARDSIRCLYRWMNESTQLWIRCTEIWKAILVKSQFVCKLERSNIFWSVYFSVRQNVKLIFLRYLCTWDFLLNFCLMIICTQKTNILRKSFDFPAVCSWRMNDALVFRFLRFFNVYLTFWRNWSTERDWNELWIVVLGTRSNLKSIKSRVLILKRHKSSTFSHPTTYPAIIDHQESQINLLKPFYSRIDG